VETTKVILFEDESLLANDLKLQLGKHGYEVSAMFRKAEDGLAYLENIPKGGVLPDVVLMDISLAGEMDGITAAGIITKRYAFAIVFLTGMSQFEVFEKAFITKPFAFLIKPFEVHQAMVSIKLAVYQKNLENELRRNQQELEEKVRERTAELLEAKNEAEQAILAKNAFLANISAQIREPMYGILGLSAMMKEEMKEKPTLQRYMQYMEDNAKHLFTLLNKIIQLSDDLPAHSGTS